MTPIEEAIRKLLIEKVVQAWCVPPNTAKTLDGDLASTIIESLIPALVEMVERIIALEHKPMSQCGGNCNHPYACRSNSAGAALICIACREQKELVERAHAEAIRAAALRAEELAKVAMGAMYKTGSFYARIISLGEE